MLQKRTGKLKRRLARMLVLSMMAGIAGLGMGCRRGFGKEAQGKVKVVASIYPVYDFVQKVGGDQVAVLMLVPSGTEPHTWEPSSRDMLVLEEADMFVYNGAGMEAWAEDITQSVQNKDLMIVEASCEVELLKIDHDEEHEEHDHKDEHEDHDEEGHHHHGEFDPHVWLSPENAKIEMRTIMEALKKTDPEHAEIYEKNFQVASQECDKLDAEYRAALSPYEGKHIVVAHEAYGYLCHAYGLEQIGIEGVSADQEPDAARMREIIDMAKEYDIKCFFFEELVDPKVAKTIADEAGCQTAALSPLDGLTKEDIDSGREYFSVMRDNLNSILKAFA